MPRMPSGKATGSGANFAKLSRSTSAGHHRKRVANPSSGQPRRSSSGVCTPVRRRQLRSWPAGQPTTCAEPAETTCVRKCIQDHHPLGSMRMHQRTCLPAQLSWRCASLHRACDAGPSRLRRRPLGRCARKNIGCHGDSATSGQPRRPPRHPSAERSGRLAACSLTSHIARWRKLLSAARPTTQVCGSCLLRGRGRKRAETYPSDHCVWRRNRGARPSVPRRLLHVKPRMRPAPASKMTQRKNKCSLRASRKE